MSECYISRHNLLVFMEENGQAAKEEEIKILFAIYGYKDKINYREFLNYIYPFNIDVIKNISMNHAKKYIKPDKKISEEILAMFIILLEKEI